MTQEELDALPEAGGLSQEIRIIDGQRVTVPVMLPTFALWANPDEPISVLDSSGQRWMVGWYDGVRYKSRLPSL